MTINPFQPSVPFDIETSHLFCSVKQMTGFYMKRNTGLKWVKGLMNFGIDLLTPDVHYKVIHT